MSTTALLVEILIVGGLFFITLVPVASWFLRIDPLIIINFYKDISIIYQIVGAYATGILWNRVCDQLFHPLDNRIIASKFSSKEAYQEARIQIVIQSESMRDYIGNYRSLIRVSRATSVLLLVYSIFVPIYILSLFPAGDLTNPKRAAISILVVILFALSVFAWYRLERGYVAAIEDAHNAISKENSSRS